MIFLKLLRTGAYGVSAGVVFLAVLYAVNLGDIRMYFGPVPNPYGILIILGGLSLVFVGVGMLLARVTGDAHDF